MIQEVSDSNLVFVYFLNQDFKKLIRVWLELSCDLNAAS